MARITPLFSGSSGNCIAIGGSDSFVLIDAGVSAKRITEALSSRGYDLSKLRGIFITHEHRDHISGVRVLASRRGGPVYATAGTLCAMDAGGDLCGVQAQVCPWEGVEIGGMQVKPFGTMHDTVESCGYVVTTADERRVAIATDTGCVTEAMREAIVGCDVAYIESNHDKKLLEEGMYPFVLKQRILSPRGHLSNEQCAGELQRILENGCARFFLGHISKENNRPELAMQSARAVFDRCGAKAERDYILHAVPPEGLPTMVF